MKIEAKCRFNKGFALAASVMMMILLALITLGLLQLASVNQRSEAYAVDVEKARANARLGLLMALGQLQLQAGQDTRATSNVSQKNPDSPNGYWVAVYNTRLNEDLSASPPVSGEFPVGHHEHQRYLTDLRSHTPTEPAAYLVSGQDPDPAVALNKDNSILFLNTGNRQTSVRAPTVSVNGSSYAYWISDNSMKILYNKGNPYAGSQDQDPDASAKAYYGGTVAQTPGFEELEINGIKPFAGHKDKTEAELYKGISLETAELLFQNSEGLPREAFHLVTGNSAAVFSNPQVGGLKVDLTPFIESGDITPTDDDAGLGLVPLKTTDPIIAGDHHIKTSPRFGIFKDWADMRFKITGDNANAAIEPQTSSASFVQSFPYALPTKRRDLTDVSENYLQPVMVECSLGWDFSPYNDGGGEKLRTHLFPRVILWNPHNVTLKTSRYVVVTRVPAYGLFYHRGDNRIIEFRKMAGLANHAELDKQASFSPAFVTTKVELAPGECKVFSPDMASSSGRSLGGRAREFDPINISNNVLSADAPPGSNNFFVDTDVDLVPETPENRDKPYGFLRSTNGINANHKDGNADQYILLYTDEPEEGNITHANLADLNYESVAHFVARRKGETPEFKWYAAGKAPHPFEDISQWTGERLPPRLWRRGVRMLWFDESSEYLSVIYRGKSLYANSVASLSLPLLTEANLHGGVMNHGNPHAYRMHGAGADMPHLDGFAYPKRPIDPDLFVNHFPISPIGRPDDGFPERVILFDVPRENPGIFSLGQFQHAQFSYNPWDPTFILGSSYSTVKSNLDASALRTPGESKFLVTDDDRWKNNQVSATRLIQTHSSISRRHDNEVLIYDTCYELNHSIWDRFMLSGVPYRGYSGGRQVAWDGLGNLPVSGYKARSGNGYSLPEFVDHIEKSDSFLHYHAAEMLLNHGAFNVNCDNKEVWKAFLMSLRNKQRPNLAHEDSGKDLTFLSRCTLATNAGGDSTEISNSKDEGAWAGLRALSDEEVDRLAEQLVAQARLRGPYVSLSDFINRRLSTNEDIASSGAIQSAIDNAGINANLEVGVDTCAAKAADLGHDKALEIKPNVPILNRADYKTTGLPGYLSQSDLLTAMVPSLTTRGDTFTIRAYGDSRDSNGKVLAVAYCEAVVQRLPDYVDGSDSAVEPVRIYNTSSKKWEVNMAQSPSERKGLSRTNLALGRRFKMIRFRWLSPSEV